MKTLIVPFLGLLMIAACSDTPDIIDEIADGRAKPPTPEQAFEYRTHNLNKNGQALACGDMYKLVGDSCVLRIDGELRPQLNYGHIIIDSTNSKLIELWIFQKDKASLNNLCTDVIVTVTGKEPQRSPARFHPESGQLMMGEETITEQLDGIHYTVPVRSVLVERLVFEDFRGKTITLTNELIWKVKDSGTPG